MNSEKYLSNPLNAFNLIRRMHHDWPQIEKWARNPVYEDSVEFIREIKEILPTSNDIIEASDSLYRLQMVYDLSPVEISEGLLNGKQYDSKLKSIDRYFMGQHLFSEGLFYYAHIWINSSLQSYEPSDYYEIIDFGKEKIYELYAETIMQLEYPQSAFNAIKQTLNLKPNDERLLKRSLKIQHEANVVPEKPIQYSPPNISDSTLGCRGGFSLSSSQFYCVYNITTSQFWHLAPLKMEILQLDPYMVLYHDVLSDREIEDLKFLAKRNLKREQIYNPETSAYEVFEERTRKHSYLSSNDSDLIMSINRRIGGMVGASVRPFHLHVAEYGLGGHNMHHYDAPPLTEEEKNTPGHRVPSILFYMSDVEQGGATVFPLIRTAIFPRKGSALMFENVKNGEIDERTLHVGCPVLVGSKWVFLPVSLSL